MNLSIVSDAPPGRVRVWTTKAATRDFRESKWTAADAEVADAAFAYRLPAPGEGFAAMLGEAIYHEGTENEFSLSTNVRIVPSSTAVGGK